VRKTSLFSRSRAFFALFTLLVFVILAVPIFVYAQSNSTNTTNSSQRIGVKITSPKANQTVPIGELTVNGTSSDSPQTNCQVFVDLNDTKPMQNVTGVGVGGPKDYSNWTFTYTQNYHVIDKGMNELTSKISCYDNSGSGKATTKYYSINITGTDNPTSFIPTTGFHTVAYSNVLPQYSTIDTNNSKSLDENVGNNSESLVYEPTGNVYSGNNDNRIDNSNDNNDGNDHRSSSNPGDSKHNHDSNSNNNNDNGGDKNKDNEKTKSHSSGHSKSLKVEKIKHTANNLKHEEHLKNLSKYIHNVVKERLHHMTERLSD